MLSRDADKGLHFSDEVVRETCAPLSLPICVRGIGSSSPILRACLGLILLFEVVKSITRNITAILLYSSFDYIQSIVDSLRTGYVFLLCLSLVRSSGSWDSGSLRLCIFAVRNSAKTEQGLPRIEPVSVGYTSIQLRGSSYSASLVYHKWYVFGA